MGKRKQREDDDGPAPSSEPASIGQQTSHIANKQKRSAAYAKLKHKKEASLAGLTDLLVAASNCPTELSFAESQANRKNQAAGSSCESRGAGIGASSKKDS